MAAADQGQRLDKFLAAHSGRSRGVCRQAIGDGGVWLRGERVRRLSRTVAQGEVYELVLAARPQTATRDPTILYEDRWLLALDKPAGLPSQGTLDSETQSALGFASRHVGAEVFSVHRLDAGTSGVLVVAKGKGAASQLASAFREGLPRKVYLAFATGSLAAERLSLNAPLKESPTPGRMQVAKSGGLAAQTDCALLARAGQTLLVAARPRTGRTHQIRVHLAHAGAPLLGDRRYRGAPAASLPDGRLFPARRPMLHAALLELPHPEDGRPLRLAASLPHDFEELAFELGWTERLTPSPDWP
ncbi:MAG: RluA family pseudouridine synthase [Deltaproteobacteria bacterium]